MTRPLTPSQRDDRKWFAARVYLLAFILFNDCKRDYGMHDNRTYEAWHYLMQARTKYLKAAKL